MASYWFLSNKFSSLIFIDFFSIDKSYVTFETEICLADRWVLCTAWGFYSSPPSAYCGQQVYIFKTIWSFLGIL